MADKTSQNLTYEKILSDIKEQNYVEVPFPMLKEELDDVARHFLDFLTLSQDVKDRFTFILDEKDRGSNAGYARKLKTRGDSDDKEYFNYRGTTERLFADLIAEYQGDSRVQNFFKSARKVLDAATETLKKVIKVIDARHGGIYNKIFSEHADRLLALRFIKYDASGRGEFLAKAHYDRSSCTLAIAESSSGLRIGKDVTHLKEVFRHGNTALFFPSLTFADGVGSSEFTPGWHDVVQKSNQAYSKDVARWAIVFFADIKHGREITYEDAHVPKDY